MIWTTINPSPIKASLAKAGKWSQDMKHNLAFLFYCQQTKCDDSNVFSVPKRAIKCVLSGP